MPKPIELNDLAADLAFSVVETAKKNMFHMTTKNEIFAMSELENMIADWIDANMTQDEE